MDPLLQSKRLLVVNAARSAKASYYRRLKELWVYLIVLSPLEASWIQDCVDEWIIADVYDKDTSIQAIQQYQKEHTIDGVLTFWDDSVPLTAQITDHLWLPGIPYETAYKIKNKYEFRQACEYYHLPHAQSHIIHTEQDLDWIITNMMFPVVLKPCYGAASTHTIKITDKKDLKETYHHVLSQDIDEVESFKNGIEFYVEEYLVWDEIDIDVVVQDGIVKFQNVMDNQVWEEPYFIEIWESWPSVVDKSLQQDMFTIVNQTVQAFALKNCILHYEFKLTPKWPIPLEVNLRMWWGAIYNLVKSITGIDLVQSAAYLALWITWDFTPSYTDDIFVSQYPLPDKSGTITRLDIDTTLVNDPAVIEYSIFKKVWETMNIPPEWYDNFDLWCIIVKGNTLSQAQQKMQQVIDSLHIETI